jgi:hypothetical protein
MVRIVNGQIVPDGQALPPGAAGGDIERGEGTAAAPQSSVRGALSSLAAVNPASWFTGSFEIAGRHIPKWALVVAALVLFLLFGFRGLLIALGVALVVLLIKRAQQAGGGGGLGQWLAPGQPGSQQQAPPSQPGGRVLGGGIHTFSELPRPPGGS